MLLGSIKQIGSINSQILLLAISHALLVTYPRWERSSTTAGPGQNWLLCKCCMQIFAIITLQQKQSHYCAADDPSVSQSLRRPLLGPSPGWKRLLPISHLRHYSHCRQERGRSRYTLKISIRPQPFSTSASDLFRENGAHKADWCAAIPPRMRRADGCGQIFTTEYEISGRVVTVWMTTVNLLCSSINCVCFGPNNTIEMLTGYGWGFISVRYFLFALCQCNVAKSANGNAPYLFT